MGPLRVHPTNPRYFSDGSGKAVYLTRSHTWTNLLLGQPVFGKLRSSGRKSKSACGFIAINKDMHRSVTRFVIPDTSPPILNQPQTVAI